MKRTDWPAIAVALALVAVLAAPADGQRRRDREVLEELETRVGVLEQQIRADNVVALINAQDELRREIQSLRDAVERLDEDLRRNAELRRSQFAALEARLAELEARGLMPAPMNPQDPAGPPDAADSTQEQAPGEQPPDPAEPVIAAGSQENYEQARELLSQGQYEAAGAEFQRYLEANSSGGLAANARYWLGETFYVQGRYEEAGAEFARVVSEHPASGKLPDAMLKLGYTQDELGDTETAIATLERVRQDFAGADASNLATIRLAQIEARAR